MTVLCLTGWQQPHDALECVFPEALHFDYGAYDSVRAMFNALPKTPRLAVGWSLGGQLLARAVEEGYVKPRHLLLLAAPFQWVADAEFPQAFPGESVAGVRRDYVTQPRRMLRNLNGLIAHGDTREKAIIRRLNARAPVWKNGIYWLDKLSYASCRKFDFSVFPPTTLVHGLKDKVIHASSAEAFKKAIPDAALHIWPECAHAPHVHNPDALKVLAATHV